jgi:hypothetical protein
MAQSYIKLKDEGKIMVDEQSVMVDYIGNQVHYKLPGADKSKKLKFKKLEYVRYGNFMLNSFANGRKVNAYHILGQTADKIAASSTRIRTRQTGGFETKYKSYEFVIIDVATKIIIQNFQFTDRNTSKDAEQRILAMAALQTQMSDCQALISRADSFDGSKPELTNGDITGLLDTPVFTVCQ